MRILADEAFISPMVATHSPSQSGLIERQSTKVGATYGCEDKPEAACGNLLNFPAPHGHPLSLTDLLRLIKLNRVLIENIRRLFFPECFQHQRVIVILIRPWRAGGRQVRAEHQRAWIGRIQISQRWTHIKVYSSKAGGFHPHALFREFEQRRETRFGETE